MKSVWKTKLPCGCERAIGIALLLKFFLLLGAIKLFDFVHGEVRLCV